MNNTDSQNEKSATTDILFLTTQTPSTIVAKWPHYQNPTIPALLQTHPNKNVTIKSWRDPDILKVVRDYNVVTFLWCNEYYKYPASFLQFLDKLQESVKTNLSASGKRKATRIINNVDFIKWNSTKSYLFDMQRAGYTIPRTLILPDPQTITPCDLQKIIQDFSPASSVVLKPAMSASSTMTRRIVDTATLSTEDITFLSLCCQGTAGGLSSAFLIQDFEAAILEHGEYSFVFVAGTLTHVVLKAPKKGDFRVQDEFGGSARLTDKHDIASGAVRVVFQLFETLSGWFGEIGYVRIDGLVAGEREFVLMEIEGIEPHLWLEDAGSVAMERMLKVLGMTQ